MSKEVFPGRVSAVATAGYLRIPAATMRMKSPAERR